MKIYRAVADNGRSIQTTDVAEAVSYAIARNGFVASPFQSGILYFDAMDGEIGKTCPKPLRAEIKRQTGR